MSDPEGEDKAVAAADELWDQSAELNVERGDHPLCGGAVARLGARGETSCQYALYLLRWLGRAPEEFLTGPVFDVADFQTRARTAGSAGPRPAPCRAQR